MRSAPLLFLALLTGCTSSPDTTGLDPDRILHMAGEEAGQITAPKERLTRQLNIADRQNRNGHHDDARKTLREARKTLESAQGLSNHEQLAGWISLSELSRAAQDVPFASAALDQALSALHNLGPVNERCDYVLGVAHELKFLRGKPEAAKLIVTGGQWAVEIPNKDQRRLALLSFADELFRCDDYEGARTVLRHDPDPAWRSDSLMALSDKARYQLALANASTTGFDASVSQSSILPQQPYGKQLDFKTNYQRN